MFNESKEEECKYLKDIVLKELRDEKEKLLSDIDSSTAEIIETKKYIWQNIYEIDKQELLFNRQYVDKTVASAENKEKELRKISKLIDSPIFWKSRFYI